MTHSLSRRSGASALVAPGASGVDHTKTPENVVLVGSEPQNIVVNRAVKLHAERHVSRNGEKTSCSGRK